MNTSGNRDRLIAAARRLFAEHGFEAVSVDDVAGAANLTKGAVYYQFKDKADLFRAACAAILNDMKQAVEQHTMGEIEHTVDEIVTGAEHLFDAYESQEARQLLLIDGPHVLGATDWTRLQADMGLAEHALGHLADEGLVPRAMIPALAQLLVGAFTQGVRTIATSANPKATSKQVRAAYRRLAEGLLRT